MSYTGYIDGIYQGGDICCGECGIMVGNEDGPFENCAWWSARISCIDCCEIENPEQES